MIPISASALRHDYDQINLSPELHHHTWQLVTTKQSVSVDNATSINTNDVFLCQSVSDTNLRIFSPSQISTSCLAGRGRPVTRPAPRSRCPTLTTRASGCAPPAPTIITPGRVCAPSAAHPGPGLGRCPPAPPPATRPPRPTPCQPWSAAPCWPTTTGQTP